MKTTKFISIVLFSTSLFGCGQVINKQTAAEGTDFIEAAVESDFHLDFPEYGFSLDAPCVMEDVSAQASGDFILNYGGVTDGNDRERMAAYQLIVNRVPIGYRDLPKEQYDKKVDEALRSQAQRFRTFKAIRFSYEGFPGYACETSHNGYGQKGVMFVMDNYIIALTVISNNDLETKFNKFTNGFKRIKSNQ